MESLNEALRASGQLDVKDLQLQGSRLRMITVTVIIQWYSCHEWSKVGETNIRCQESNRMQGDSKRYKKQQKHIYIYIHAYIYSHTIHTLTGAMHYTTLLIVQGLKWLDPPTVPARCVFSIFICDPSNTPMLATNQLQ